jgi:hypothetical protein
MSLALRLLLAIVVGITTFFTFLSVPLLLISAIRGDPGDIAGGIATIFIGLPVGLIGGLACGVFAFKKIAV